METLLGFIAGIGTAICKTATDLGTKSATRNIASERLILALQAAISAAVVWVTCLAVYPQIMVNPVSAFGAMIGPDFWWVLVLDGGLNAIAFFCYIRALRCSDASRVAPLMLFTPVLLLLTSRLMLGQRIPFVGVVGVLCTVIGALFLGPERGAWKRIVSVRFLAEDRGARYMLATAAIWSVTSNLDKIGVDSAPVLIWSASVSTVIALYSIVLLLALDGVPQMRHAWRAILPGTTSAFGHMLQMFALTTLYVPYVIAIKRLSALGTVIGGGLLFGEDARDRVIGTLIMLMGTVLIVLGS